MVNAIVSLFTIILLSTLLFSLAASQEPEDHHDRYAVIKRAVSALRPFRRNYLRDLRRNRESEKIKVRVWTHNGDPKMNGCGLFFMAKGQSNRVVSDYFPAFEEHRCGYESYRMRMLSPRSVYDKTLQLSNDNIKDVEVHADGWYNTYNNVMCFGLTERTISNGPRAFCINNLLLKGCKRLYRKWDDVNIDFDNIMVTRSTRGAHKIIFRDADRVVRAVERLDRNLDDRDAIFTLCDRIELQRGGDPSNSWDCPADRLRSFLNAENKNPYGCRRYRWGDDN